MDQSTCFQLIPVDDGDPQLGGAVPGCGIAPACGDDGSLGALSAKPVPQNGKLIQRLGLHITDLAADEQGNNTSGGHHVDLIDHTAMPKDLIPANNGAADDIVENIGIQAGFINIQLQNAANIPQPGPGIAIPEAEGDTLPGNDLEIPEEAHAQEVPEGFLLRADPAAPFSLDGIVSLTCMDGACPASAGDTRCI